MSVSSLSLNSVKSRSNAAGQLSTRTGLNWWYNDIVGMPDISATDDIVVGLVAVFENSNYLALFCTVVGGYVVDWGDGTAPQTVATSVVALHQYDYTVIPDSQMTGGFTINFKYAIVTVTPVIASTPITVFDINRRHTAAGLTVGTTSPWLAIKINTPNATSIVIGAATHNVTHRLLQGVVIYPFINTLSCSYMFRNCTALFGANIYKDESVGRPSPISSASYMFANCYSLTHIYDSYPTNTLVASNTGIVDASYMFQNCTSLTLVPPIYTNACATTTYMFAGCTALATDLGIWEMGQRGIFDLGSCSNSSYMFSGCSALTKNAVLFRNIAAGNNMSYMFSGCSALQEISLFDTSGSPNTSYMFQNCKALRFAPRFNLSACTNASYMFYNCTTLEYIDQFIAGPAAINMSYMFYGCSRLVSSFVYSMQEFLISSGLYMFYGCTSLQVAPIANFSQCTTTSYMFAGCSSLPTLPISMDMPQCTDSSYMFQNCTVLNYVSSNINPSLSATNLSYMFYGCAKLDHFIGLDIRVSVNTSYMFWGCTSLTYTTLYCPSNNTAYMFFNCSALVSYTAFAVSAATTTTFMFSGCSSLAIIQSIDVSASTVLTSMFATCSSLTQLLIMNAKYTFSVTACKLSRTSIEYICNNVATRNPAAAQTLTLTTNPGLDSVAKTCTATAGSVTLVSPNATGLAIGMYVYGTGTGITTGIAITFTDAGDLVTLAAHGLANDDVVAFSVITTTTGIAINTTYYVINATANNFQISLEPGSTTIALTTDGTGTLRYITKIVSFTTTSITLDRKMVSAGSVALTIRYLNTNLALLRGWTVTG